jgi:hypothetical protein
MRRKGHPSFPSAMTCCFFSSLKTLLMPKEPIRAALGESMSRVLSMAGFQLTLHGRIWVIPEGFRFMRSTRLASSERKTDARHDHFHAGKLVVSKRHSG